MACFYLNSYGPLVISRAGRVAVEQYELDPFIDGSIRREPDFKHRYPGISCLCRARKFTPRLGVGDVVAYLTQKRKYFADQPERRLTAILRVQKCFKSHVEAAKWYRKKRQPLPSNCMVRGNGPNPMNQCHGLHGDQGCVGRGELRGRWDGRYRERCKNFPIFVVCQALFRDVSKNAPAVKDADLKHVFGEIPSTQNPGAHCMESLKQLVLRLGLRLRLKMPD